MARSPAIAVLLQGLPLAFGLASHVVVNLVDLVLVGRLGEAAVAGVHVATTVNFLPMIVGNGMSVAAMALMAQRLGAGDTRAAAELNRAAERWMLIVGLVAGVLGAVTAVPCVELQGVTGAARDIGVHYLVVAQLGSVAMFALMQTTAAMRALGESVMPVAVLLLANLLNLVLDVVLMFGWDAVGVPACGAVGAAYASVLARLVASGVAVWWIRRPGYPLRLRAGSSAMAASGFGVRLVSLALPQSAQMLIRALVVLALTRIAADVGGQEAVVALGVTTRLDTLVLFSALGFASAATTQVGAALGAGRPDRARRAAWAGAGWALLLGALWVAGFRTWARPLIGLFVADASPGVVEAGALYLGVAALGHPFAAAVIAAAGALNGAGRFVTPMVVDLLGHGLLLLPLLVWAAVGAERGLEPVWWAFAAGSASVALVYAVVLRMTAWQLPASPTLSD